MVVQVFGLAALPLCLRLFRHLPDSGYGLSKPLGLLLAGWAFWIMTTFGWLHNIIGGIIVTLALLAATGLFIFSSTHSSLTNLLPHWRTIFVTELLFALAFAAWCLVRAHMPRIETAGGEKWMEIAFLRAILRSETFPPHDPWLSGFGISYYYFGYIIVAMITRLAAVPPPVAFNLGIAVLFALVCTGAFSLVYNLIGTTERTTGQDSKGNEAAEAANPVFSAIAGGLLGPLLVAVMGNLEGLLEMLHARGLAPAAFWAWLDIHAIDGPAASFAQGSWTPTRFFWWWQASRVLQDYTPWGSEQLVIDEFPAFSFILGDMHPHVLALPFVLLALTLALNLYLRMGIGDWKLKDAPFEAWEFLIYALCLGGLGFLNTWDFPTYLFVVAAAYALALMGAGRRAIRDVILHFASLFGALLVAGLLLYFPFWISFQSQAGGILLNPFNATRLPQFLIMFGPLLFIAAAFIIDQARRSNVSSRETLKWTLIVTISILGLMALALSLIILLVWLNVIPAQGAATYVAAWLRGGPIPGLPDVENASVQIRQSLFAHLLNPWVALGLVTFLVAAYLTLRQIRHSPFAIRKFVILLFATGALLTLGVEYVYLRDNFGTRMNTVFKFYFQAWVMWGIAGAYALARFIRRGRIMVAGVALLLIAAGLIYPVLAIPARAGESGGPLTLDGAANLAETHPDDYAAIAWLNQNVDGAPVILEAPGDRMKSYTYEGRVSAHTGLPTLLGWAGHEHQWRGNYDEPSRREPDIEALYTSVDLNATSVLLDKYNISYVYIGPLERARYPAAGLEKFSDLMNIVYDTGSVTIYHR